MAGDLGDVNSGLLLARLGTTADAAVDAAGATGTLFAKLRDLGADADAIKAYVDSLETTLGAIGDAAVAAEGATGSVWAKVRNLGVNLNVVLSRAGDNTEAATDPSAASGTLFSKLRGVGDQLDTLDSRLSAARAALLDDLTYLMDTAVTAPAANSMGDRIVKAHDIVADATFGNSAIKTLVDDLEGRLSAARAGYLDNLSGGAVALQTHLGTAPDAAVDPSTEGTLHAKVRGVGVRLGSNNEASTDPSAASGTIFSKLRGAGDDLDTIITRLDARVPSASIGPGIRSIQRGSLAGSGSGTSLSGTLATTLADAAKASVRIISWRDAGGGTMEKHTPPIFASLTTTTITFTVPNGANNQYTVQYEVVEYY